MCKLIFRLKPELDCYIKWIHGKPQTSLDLVCIFCERPHTTTSSFQQHLIVHIEERSFNCLNYEKQFSSVGAPNRHMKKCARLNAHTC